MFNKTDEYFKRKARVWLPSSGIDDEVSEYVRRETWWLCWLIPIYSRETIFDKPR